MANVLCAQAKYPEALKMHEAVLAIRVEKLGLEYLSVATTYCMATSGMCTKARESIRRLLKCTKSVSKSKE